MKHMKTWVLDTKGNWIGTAASFGPDRVQNVHCAIFVPAQHQGRAPGDSCIVTGFPDGTLGMWIPPFPTRAGSKYALVRVYRAHEPGPLATMNDGSQQYGGVCCLQLCKKPGCRDVVLASGGADGSLRVHFHNFLSTCGQAHHGSFRKICCYCRDGTLLPQLQQRPGTVCLFVEQR